MKEIENILGIHNVKYNEPMSNHTTFKVGGPAEIYVEIDSITKLEKVIEICKKAQIKINIIGNGSNLLVSDDGVKGIVIRYIANEVNINKKNGKVVCSAGVLNSVLAQELFENELSGFEFAASIPGTIGGATYMNAGAFGEEIKNIVDYVKYIDIEKAQLDILQKEELEFSYRKSIFQKMKVVIVEVGMQFIKGDKQIIADKMNEYKKIRIEKQPLELRNAGSTFKRGEDFISAKIIDDAGLKGYTIGGAQVSTKHSGFIVNTGNATAKDILQLIDYVKKVVYEKYGKILETEIIYLK